MLTALSRIIKYGLLAFWRNGWVTAATVSVMLLALIVFEGMIIFSVITTTTLDVIKDKIDISVYFKTDTSEDEMLKIEKSVESLAEVDKVEYISKDKALEIFKATHSGNETISQSLDVIKENPLLASLNIKAKDPKYYSDIAKSLDVAAFKDKIESVSYNKNAAVIDKLNKIIDTVNSGGILIIIFLSITAVLVTFNTISLAIYSNREEIGIMRLVGASNSLIRGPYVLEGIVYGIIGAILSIIILLPIVYFVGPHVDQFIKNPEVKLWNYFTYNMLGLFGYQLLFGIFLGVVSSTIAIRKYLKI